MANQEHLERLKQSVNIWNQWRDKNPELLIDLSGVNLGVARLNDSDLEETIWITLSTPDLRDANLRDTDLSNADLRSGYLQGANLHGACLRGADLRGANLRGANLRKTDLSSAITAGTVFAEVDLRETKGLAEIHHNGPSDIELYTVRLPQDGSALYFLRGAGVPNEWIDLWRSMMAHPIDYYSCFISYSSKDETFARRLYADLQSHNVRCWFAPEDMKIGDTIRDRIDQSIRLYDKLLLILSEQSVMSEWVEDEVEAAMEKERLVRERGEERMVLFPVRLDETVMTTQKAWAAKLRRQRHIGDFSSWKNHDKYQKVFNRLLRDLKAET